MPSLSTLSAVAGRGTYAGTATLKATLAAGDSPLSGATVAFALRGATAVTSVGSATTDAQGVATLPDVPLAGFNAGIAAGAVAASFAGDATDAASNASGDLVVGPAQAMLSLGGLAATYDGTPHMATVATDPAGLAGVSVAYYNENNVAVAPPTHPGSYIVVATLDNPNYSAPIVAGNLIVDQATPAIAWPSPADITYGTPLGAAQLDATSSIPGTFAYTQPAGLVLKAGAGQVLSGTFTPDNTVDYASVTTTTTIDVRQVTPVLTWAHPDDITYGTPLGVAQLDANASVPGTFAYTPAAGKVLNAGAGQVLSATFTPIDTADYASVTTTTTIDVLKATPVLAWARPADIAYGTPLGVAQLDANASVPGTFAYTPAAGDVLGAGPDQALSVRFTPDDTADFDGAGAGALINVVPAPLTVTVEDASKVYGQPNPAFVVRYDGFVNGDDATALGGSLAYGTAAGPASDVGSYDVTATGLSAANYAIRYVHGTLAVTPAEQAIAWSNPAAIVYGTPLGAAQLDATVSVAGPAPPGTLTYTPAAGTILDAGRGQVLTVVAAATQDYHEATATVAIDVLKATPVLTWSAPAAIVYGTPLSAAQLDAVVSATGPTHVTLAYSPAAGTVLPAGPGQTLTVTAAATANDNAVSRTVTIDVLKAMPTITWPNPADIVYGTPLGAAQLDAAASVAGTFAYTPAAGNVPDAGQGQALAATFTPADPADFDPVTVTARINVARAPLIIAVNDAATTYGAPIPAPSGSVVGLQNNDPMGVTYSTTAAVGSPAGTYAITPALIDPNRRLGNYAVVFQDGTLTVNPAPLTVTADDARIVAGQPLPAFTARESGFVLGEGPLLLDGVLTFRVPDGAAGQAGRYPITPGGLVAANYAITYVDGLLDVASPAVPPVIVQGVRWQARKPGHGKTSRVLVVSFSAALDPGVAQDLAAYTLTAAGRNPASGNRHDRPIPLASATYDPGAHTVTLTPRGKVPGQALQLSLHAALILDAQGRPIDGNRDGQPGGDFVTTLGNPGLRPAAVPPSGPAQRRR